MFSRSSAFFRSHVGKRVLRNAQQQTQQTQKRAMGGGGAYMQTNEFGERLGEAFGTIAWLWVFYRFQQDGRVLLGFEHPWDHGHHDDIYGSELRVQGLTHKFQVKKQSQDEMIANWDAFNEKSINPGEDDDDDDDDDDEDDDEDEDDEEEDEDEDDDE